VAGRCPASMSRPERLARDRLRLSRSAGHLGRTRAGPRRRRPADDAPAWRGDVARAARRIRLSRVCLGCRSVAIWVFVRLTRSFLLFEMYGDPGFTFRLPL